jgi:abhydrolase domain-containing protein 12
MHALRFPWNAKFDTPELYGLARRWRFFLNRWLFLTIASAGKTLNLNFTTSDGVRLGAWFVAADGFYQKHLRLLPLTNGPANLEEKRYRNQVAC